MVMEIARGFGLTIAVAYGIVYVGDMRPGWGNHPIYALYTNVTAGNYTYADSEPRIWSDTSAVYGYHGFTFLETCCFTNPRIP